MRRSGPGVHRELPGHVACCIAPAVPSRPYSFI